MLYVHNMKQTYEYRGKNFSLELSPAGKLYQAGFGGKTVTVELVRMDGAQVDLLIDGVLTRAYVSRDGDRRWVTVDGQTLLLVNAGETRKSGAQAGPHAGVMLASMPGLVRLVAVAEGDRVKKGQTLAVLEAMKMENKLLAPFDGLVKKLLINVGQTVERDQVLMEITRLEPPVTDPENVPG